jgi:long-chain acyl-CoA synthetase
MHLSELAARHPDKPAVIMADGSRAVTFAELDSGSCRVSRLLAGLGVGPGDHVAVLMANRLEYFAVAWGAQRRGTYWTPVNWHLTADEAGYIVEDCGAKVLLDQLVGARLAAGRGLLILAGHQVDLVAVQPALVGVGVGDGHLGALLDQCRAADGVAAAAVGDDAHTHRRAGRLLGRPES